MKNIVTSRFLTSLGKQRIPGDVPKYGLPQIVTFKFEFFGQQHLYQQGVYLNMGSHKLSHFDF
jgi:hypothetical protein